MLHRYGITRIIKPLYLVAHNGLTVTMTLEDLFIVLEDYGLPYTVVKNGLVIYGHHEVIDLEVRRIH